MEKQKKIKINYSPGYPSKLDISDVGALGLRQIIIELANS